MSIQITPDIAWSPGEANAEARQWIADNVLTAEPQRDKYGRPYLWTATTDTARVTVTREYIRPGAWAKRRDIINVSPVNDNDQ